MSNKAGSTQKSYNYHGSVSGLICKGPIDGVKAVIVDGKAVWEGNDTRPTGTPPGGGATINNDYDDFTSRLDPKWFPAASTGWARHLRVYWGIDTQAGAVQNSAASGHPDYRGWAYVSAHRFLFGLERTAAPNIEVIVWRKPIVPTGIVAAEDNDIQDGQANPVAALAELLLSDHGAGIPEALFDGASWQAAATYAKTNPDRMYCSPYLADAADTRAASAGLLMMFDGALAWTKAGKLAVRLLKPGVNPGGLPEITESWMTAAPKFGSGSWGDVPTAVTVKHRDRDRKYKEGVQTAQSLVAVAARGREQLTTSVSMPMVTRGVQALRWAAEFVRRSLHPAVTVDVSVRPEKIPGVTVGSKVLVDIDPTPGGTALMQLAVVEERRDKTDGPTTLRLVADPLASAEVYAPTPTLHAPQVSTVDPIINALLIPLPPALMGSPSVAVLATRPQPDVNGYEVAFVWDTDGDASLADETPTVLGRGAGYAVRLGVTASATATTETISLEVLDVGSDPVDSADHYLTDRMPDSGLESQSDTFLIVFANVDGNGRVVVTSGAPELEFLSVVSRAPGAGAEEWTYTVLRARLGLPARAWTTSAKAWLLPKINLLGWHHPDMVGLLRAGLVGTFRIAPTSPAGAGETLLEKSFIFPASYDPAPRVTWTTPSGTIATTDGTGIYTVAFAIKDWEGDLTAFRVHVDRPDGNVDEVEMWMPVGAVRDFAWSKAITFTTGVSRVVVTARDQGGRESVSARWVLKAGIGTITPPTFTPIGSDDLPLRPVDVTLTASGTATKIQYMVVSIGLPAPAGAGTEVAATTVALKIVPFSRVWARAGDGGGAWSAWISSDYSTKSATGGPVGGGGGGGRIVELN